MADASIGGSPLIPDKEFVNTADWREVFTVEGFSTRELSQMRGYMQLRPTPGSLSVMLSLSSPNNGLLFDPANLRLHINVPARLTRLIAPGVYVRDFIFMLRGGAERRFAGRGNVTIIQGVTQDAGQIEKWLTV